MSGVSVLRGFRPKKKRSKHNSEQDMHDALKIDWRTNEIRLDRILQRLDDPDPTGALFGIKADSSWTDFADKEMESAIGGPVMVNFIPPKESPKATSILRKPSPKQEREMEMKKRKRYVEAYPDADELAQYQRHRRQGCECCTLHSVFAHQMPKGVRLCSVFKAAFYSVMRDSAKKDVEEKRKRLKKTASGHKRQGSSGDDNEESDKENSKSGGSPPGMRGM